MGGWGGGGGGEGEVGRFSITMWQNEAGLQQEQLLEKEVSYGTFRPLASNQVFLLLVRKS